jgi:hypothetical protein
LADNFVKWGGWFNSEISANVGGAGVIGNSYEVRLLNGYLLKKFGPKIHGHFFTNTVMLMCKKIFFPLPLSPGLLCNMAKGQR